VIRVDDVTTSCTGGYGSAYGSLPRNHFRGPNKTNLDMTLAKSTKITERVNLQLRVDAFNLFNHANPREVQTIADSPHYGQFLNNAWREYRGKFVFEF